MAEQLETRTLLSTYDAAAMFSYTANPNGVWGYGDIPPGAPGFEIYDTASALDIGQGAAGWTSGSDSPPYVGEAPDGSNGSTVVLPPGVLDMHPGPNGEYSVVQFTAPDAGPLSATFTFTGIDDGEGTTTDVHVLHNDVSLADGSINGFGDTFSDTLSAVPVAAGDTIDFTVGWGANQNYLFDSTSLSAQITLGGGLSVATQPVKTAAKKPIAPVKVDVLNADGTIDATADTAVSVSLAATTDEVGKLDGKTTVDAVDGVATFDDLSVSEPGDYTLNFSDAANDTAASAVFPVTGGKLVFTKEPADVALNSPLDATVEYEDQSDKLDTGVSGTVDLTLNTIKGGAGAVLGGTTSVDLVDGIATFSGENAPTINVSGTYTLTATQFQDDGSTGGPQPVDITETGLSKPIEAADDTLKFKKAPPSSADLGSPIPFEVEALDIEKKVDISYSDQIQLSLNVIQGNAGAAIGGTVLMSFSEGVAMFSDTAGPTIDTPGAFTLTVTPVAPDETTGELAPSASASPITSTTIKISGDHLVFKPQPKDTDVDTAIPFEVELEDSKNKVDTDATSSVMITLDQASVLASADLSGTDTLAFAGGIASFPDQTETGPGTGLNIDTPGTYTFTATELVPDQTTGELTASLTSDPVKSDSFKITGDHLTFKTQPADADAGAPILSKIELLDADNKVVTDSGASQLQVTLNTIKGPDSAALEGNKTVPFVNGVVSFTSTVDTLLLETPGTFTLSVDELSPDESTGELAVVTTTLDATSNEFKITGDHLVFIQQPADSDSASPLLFKVALEDSKNKIATDTNSNSVDVSLDTVTGGENATLKGSTTTAFASGIVTYDTSNTLSIEAPGEYTLTASETDGLGQPVDTTDDDTSDSFKISGDHIVFIKQPADANAEDPIPFTVAAENSKDRVDTNVTADVEITFDAVTGGVDAALTGTTDEAFVGGMAKFDGLTAPALDTPGTYDFTATQGTSDGSGGLTPDATSEPGTSAAFKISGDHLVFKVQPADSDTSSPIAITVETENARNQVDTNVHLDHADITLDTISGGVNAELSGTTNVQFAAGVAAFSVPDAPQIDVPGTYTFTATELGTDTDTGDTVAVTTTQDGASKQFKVSGDHLMFKQQPADSDATAPIEFEVVAEDSKNKVDPDVDGSVVISLNTVSGGADAALVGTTQQDLVGGITSFTSPTAPHIDVPGTYTLTATQEAADETTGQLAPVIDDEPATSNSFKVAGNHVVFEKEPQDTGVDASIVMTIALEDSKNKIVTDANSDTLGLTLNTVSGGTDAAITGDDDKTFTAGVVVYDAANQLSLDTPGTYTFTAGDYAIDPSTGELAEVPTTTEATSGSFKVTGNHLVFTRQPADADADAPLLLTVSVEDSKNKVVTSEHADSIEFSLNTISGGESAQLTGDLSLPLVNGVADATATSEISIDTEGTYTLSAAAVSPDAESGLVSPDATITDATSKSFRVTGDKLVFSQEPVDSGVDAPLVFAVTVEDATGKVVDANNDHISLDLNTISGGTDAMLSTDPLPQFAGGVARFTVADQVSVNAPGSYTFTATDEELDESTGELTPRTTTVDATSKVFKITGDHLVFTKDPEDTGAGAGLAFAVELEDSENKLVTDSSGDSVQLSLNTIEDGAGAKLNGDTSIALDGGVVTVAAEAGVNVAVLGKYTLGAAEVSTDQTTDAVAPVDTTEAATSKEFSITGDHLKFIKEPKGVAANSPILFTVEIDNADNKPDTDVNAAVLVTLDTIPAGGKAQLSGLTKVNADDGVSDFSADQAVMIDTPGTYQLTATEVQATDLNAGDATPILTADPIFSTTFKITAPN